VNLFPVHPPPLALIVQDTAPAEVPDLGARLAGVAAQLAAGLALVAISALTVFVYWQLLKITLKNPSAEKVAMVVLIPMLAAFFVGAAPDLIDISYSYGQSFLGGTP
jgi:hypothetical protein